MNPALRLLRAPAAVAALAALTAAGALVAGRPSVALGHSVLCVRTTPAKAVTDTSATLTGLVRSQDSAVSFAFELGTTSYSHVTRTASLPPGSGNQPVSVTVTGLRPATVYHFRLIAQNEKARATAGDMTFTTAAPAPAAPPAIAASPPAPVAPAPTPAPAQPVLGRSVVVAPVSGTVKLKVPGRSAYAPLAAGAAIPVGALVDTRSGAIRLTTSLGGARTQTGTFRGAVFQVRQSRGGHGMTDVILRGAAPTCARMRAGAAAVHKRRPVRRLWAQDKGGRFRTHGRNSVATVRGTRWVTTETCAGTRTTVTSGAVSVRDRHRHRSVVVRAGHSYLARAR